MSDYPRSDCSVMTASLPGGGLTYAPYNWGAGLVSHNSSGAPRIGSPSLSYRASSSVTADSNLTQVASYSSSFPTTHSDTSNRSKKVESQITRRHHSSPCLPESHPSSRPKAIVSSRPVTDDPSLPSIAPGVQSSLCTTSPIADTSAASSLTNSSQVGALVRTSNLVPPKNFTGRDVVKNASHSSQGQRQQWIPLVPAPSGRSTPPSSASQSPPFVPTLSPVLQPSVSQELGVMLPAAVTETKLSCPAADGDQLLIAKAICAPSPPELALSGSTPAGSQPPLMSVAPDSPSSGLRTFGADGTSSMDALVSNVPFSTFSTSGSLVSGAGAVGSSLLPDGPSFLTGGKGAAGDFGEGKTKAVTRDAAHTQESNLESHREFVEATATHLELLERLQGLITKEASRKEPSFSSASESTSTSSNAGSPRSASHTAPRNPSTSSGPTPVSQCIESHIVDDGSGNCSTGFWSTPVTSPSRKRRQDGDLREDGGDMAASEHTSEDKTPVPTGRGLRGSRLDVRAKKLRATKKGGAKTFFVQSEMQDGSQGDSQVVPSLLKGEEFSSPVNGFVSDPYCASLAASHLSSDGVQQQCLASSPGSEIYGENSYVHMQSSAVASTQKHFSTAVPTSDAAAAAAASELRSLERQLRKAHRRRKRSKSGKHHHRDKSSRSSKSGPMDPNSAQKSLSVEAPGKQSLSMPFSDPSVYLPPQHHNLMQPLLYPPPSETPSLEQLLSLVPSLAGNYLPWATNPDPLLSLGGLPNFYGSPHGQGFPMLSGHVGAGWLAPGSAHSSLAPLMSNPYLTEHLQRQASLNQSLLSWSSSMSSDCNSMVNIQSGSLGSMPLQTSSSAASVSSFVPSECVTLDDDDEEEDLKPSKEASAPSTSGLECNNSISAIAFGGGSQSELAYRERERVGASSNMNGLGDEGVHRLTSGNGASNEMCAGTGSRGFEGLRNRLLETDATSHCDGQMMSAELMLGDITNAQGSSPAGMQLDASSLSLDDSFASSMSAASCEDTFSTYPQFASEKDTNSLYNNSSDLHGDCSDAYTTSTSFITALDMKNSNDEPHDLCSGWAKPRDDNQHCQSPDDLLGSSKVELEQDVDKHRNLVDDELLSEYRSAFHSDLYPFVGSAGTNRAVEEADDVWKPASTDPLLSWSYSSSSDLEFDASSSSILSDSSAGSVMSSAFLNSELNESGKSVTTAWGYDSSMELGSASTAWDM